MHQLGISIYPEHSCENQDFTYMELAAKYGFQRIFTCLLSVGKPVEQIIDEFSRFTGKAHELGFTVTADTNPAVFKYLGATPSDLGAFAEIGLDILRLDGNFGEREDRIITHNPYDIKIEFNGSSDTNLEHLIRHGANPRNMLVCHNFYPQRYTGLSWKTFMGFNRKWNALGLHTAAFVSSNNRNTFGPWPVSAGLPTLEAHRGLPVDLQVRHMLACEVIDDILVGNAYATEEELAAMSRVDFTKTTVRVDPEAGISEEERRILFDCDHAGRTDASEYFIRSSLTRIEHNGRSIPARSCGKRVFTRGDIVIVNDHLEHYRGELEVILRDTPNAGERNLAGCIPEAEMMILDQIEEKVDHLFGFI